MPKTEDQQGTDKYIQGMLELSKTFQESMHEHWCKNHCVKCGSDKLDIRYSEPDDMLDYTCLQCRRKWRQKTLDNLRRENNT